MNSSEVRDIFDNTQHLHKHQKCLKQMQELYEKYVSFLSINQFISIFVYLLLLE